MNKSLLLKLSRFFLYLVPFNILIVTRSTLFPFTVGRYVFFRVVVELALVFFIWAWARGETDIKLIFSPLVKAVYIFALIYSLVGFFGFNLSASFWSNFERGEGGLQMLHLFIFFILLVLLFKDEKSWSKMLVIVAVTAILMIAYGLGAALGVPFFIGRNLCARFTGSFGNSVYAGIHMVFALFFTAILLNEENDKYKKWLKCLLRILLAVFVIILLLSQTRAALLAFAAAVIGGLFYLFFHLPNRRMRTIILTTILVLVILGGLGVKFRGSINLLPFCKKGSSRILDMDVGTWTFRVRLLLWRQAVEIFKERPILGWGPENFQPAFEKHYLTFFDYWYDRAHNTVLDYLTQAGILGLLSYSGIFAVFYWQFFRKQQIAVNSRKALIENTLFFAFPIAYLVQGVFHFEALPIYISLFLFLAFVNYKFSK